MQTPMLPQISLNTLPAAKGETHLRFAGKDDQTTPKEGKPQAETPIKKSCCKMPAFLRSFLQALGFIAPPPLLPSPLTADEKAVIDHAKTLTEKIKSGNVSYTSLEDQDPSVDDRLLNLVIDGQPMKYNYFDYFHPGFSPTTSKDFKTLYSEDKTFSLSWKKQVRHGFNDPTTTLSIEWQNATDETPKTSAHPDAVAQVEAFFKTLDTLYQESQQTASDEKKPDA